MTQAEAFAALAKADAEAFKAVVDLAVDFQILADAVTSGTTTAQGAASLAHATTAAANAKAALEAVSA